MKSRKFPIYFSFHQETIFQPLYSVILAPIRERLVNQVGGNYYLPDSEMCTSLSKRTHHVLQKIPRPKLRLNKKKGLKENRSLYLPSTQKYDFPPEKIVIF